VVRERLLTGGRLVLRFCLDLTVFIEHLQAGPFIHKGATFILVSLTLVTLSKYFVVALVTDRFIQYLLASVY